MMNPGPMDPDACVTLSEGVTATRLGDETVVLDPRAGSYFGLEAVGSRVWALLERGTTLNELARIVADEYDVEHETCRRDIRALLSDLQAAELITTCP